jgi:carboxyl-terminal processing protease
VRMADSPAAKAGLQQGDIITNIDGVDVVPTDLDGTITRLRGEAGTVVHLIVRRAGTPQPRNFTN